MCLVPPLRLLGPQKGLSGLATEARAGVGGPICRCWALSAACLDISICPPARAASRGGRRAPSSGSQCSLQRRTQCPPDQTGALPCTGIEPLPQQVWPGCPHPLPQVFALVLPLSLLPLLLCCTPMGPCALQDFVFIKYLTLFL